MIIPRQIFHGYPGHSVVFFRTARKVHALGVGDDEGEVQRFPT